jgi:hypothetical protein
MNIVVKRLVGYVLAGIAAAVLIHTYRGVLTPQSRNMKDVRVFIGRNTEALRQFRAGDVECRFTYLIDDTRADGEVRIVGYVPSTNAAARLLAFVASLRPPRPVQSHLKIWPEPDLSDIAGILALTEREQARHESNYVLEAMR